MMEKVISALIGLVGAVSNNGKTDETDKIIKKALMSIKNGENEDSVVDMIHKEKFTIAPDCATCLNPCGNTSDYDIEKLKNAPEDVRNAKLNLINALCEMAVSLKYDELSDDEHSDDVISDNVLPDDAYRAIAYLGYDLAVESYDEITDKIKSIS